jgi:membrane-bound ClpP family serine protease
MGANSKQGWYLFVFLIGFTFVVAGFAYLGFAFALLGLAFLIASLVGLHQIKPLENGSEGEQVTAPAAPSSAAKLRAS